MVTTKERRGGGLYKVLFFGFDAVLQRFEARAEKPFDPRTRFGNKRVVAAL